MGLIHKLAAIAASAKINKDMDVGTGGTKTYPARSEQKVLSIMRPLFVEQKVFPLITDIETVFVNDNNIKIKLQVTFYDLESEETIVTYGLGTGYDKVDKDSGKALTYAFKNCLLKAGLAVSGEDTDNAHSDDIIGDLKKTAKGMLDDLNEKGYFKEQAVKAGKPDDAEKMHSARVKALDLMGLSELNKLISGMQKATSEWTP